MKTESKEKRKKIFRKSQILKKGVNIYDEKAN